MTRKTFCALVTVLAVLLILPNIAAAQLFNNFESFHMTGASSDSTAKTSFAWDEKPWLYIKFLNDSDSNIYDGDNAGRSIVQSFWTWNNPSGTNETFVSYWSDTKNELWISSTDTFWNDNKKQGDWFVTGKADLHTGNSSWNGSMNDWDSYYGATAFSVTPEPVSSILFITGSLAFAGNYYRKKKELTA